MVYECVCVYERDVCDNTNLCVCVCVCVCDNTNVCVCVIILMCVGVLCERMG